MRDQTSTEPKYYWKGYQEQPASEARAKLSPTEGLSHEQQRQQPLT